MKPTPMPLADVDLDNLDYFVANDAWSMFETLRSDDPVHWTDENHSDGHGFWSVVNYEDIEAVNKDAETFTSTKFTNLEEPPEEFQDLRRSILESDGSRHQALRKLLARDFSVAQLRRYEEFLRDLARITIDQAFAQGDVDFVEAIAADFPIQVLARLLATPDEMTPQLITWGNAIVGFSDPELSNTLVDSDEAQQYKHLPFRSPVSQEIFDYGRQLAAERKGGDGEDLVSKLVNRLPEDGIPLTDSDFDNYFLLLVVAGNETTRQAITLSMKALMDNPDQMQYFLDHMDKSQQMVEELIRYASPVYHFRRTATKDLELHGKQIKEGDKVVQWFAAGNRDPKKFENPYQLDLSRFPNDHMTFGKGPHSCMGANLARLEIRILFEELLPRIATIEQTGPIERVRSNFVNGVKRFPVRLTEKK